MPQAARVACYCTSYRCNGQKQTQRQWDLHQREDRRRPLTATDTPSSYPGSQSLLQPKEAPLEKTSPVLPKSRDCSSPKKQTLPPTIEKKTTRPSDTSASTPVEDLFKHLLALDDEMDRRFCEIQELERLDPLNPLKLAPSAMLKKLQGEREWVEDTVRRVGLTPTLGSEAINIQKLAMKKRGQGILQVIKERCAEVAPKVPSEDILDNGEVLSDMMLYGAHSLPEIS
jgi:hypothetical protein